MSNAGEPPAGHEEALAEARTLLDAGLISELITEVHALAVSFRDIVGELAGDRVERSQELGSLRDRNRVLGRTLMIAIVALALLGLLGYSRLADVAEGNQATGRTLLECTTASPSPPSSLPVDRSDRVHECYEDGLIRTAQAVSSIGADVLDAAICARSVADADAITACYHQRVLDRTEP